MQSWLWDIHHQCLAASSEVLGACPATNWDSIGVDIRPPLCLLLIFELETLPFSFRASSPICCPIANTKLQRECVVLGLAGGLAKGDILN